ncbi:MAG TPA: AMP-binding protein [Pyrinomonadaceae bacterium]|jgi:acetyl-CoA synthetase|nr:AMP-binding protein [Pyrinomonadaceae bacterium]
MHDANLLEDQPIAWTPTHELIERARLTEFMRQVGVTTWDELYAYSIGDVEMFTAEVLRFLDIKFDPPYDKLLDRTDGIEFPKWCENGGLNITTMCLDRWVDNIGAQPAIVWEGESGLTRTLTYRELLDNVDACAEKLLGLNIQKGDAVGLHLPMLPETVVALLAINRLGAIAVPVFSGYGIDAITSRMEAVGAKALFTCYGTTRRGKPVDMLTIASRAVANVSSIENVIVIDRPRPSTRKKHDRPADDTQKRIYDHELQLELLKNELFHGRNVEIWGVDQGLFPAETAITPEKTLAEDPLITLYTSGTTGKPKGIAHTHASFPIKAAQDMAFGTDVGVGTRVSWYTDIGWMMGPWLIYGALINGATICIYDGAPDYPQPDRMWEFCAKHKVEVLGISPTLIRALSNCGDDLPKKHDLSSLRAFASTGEPWNPAPWRWLFEKVGDSKLPIINYSGGTEISGGILMGNPLLPIKPCSFPAPCPGMDVDILDENGKPVGAGQVGELVIKQPWIGMARGFWQEKERYLETYWSRFKNIWVHGDFAMRDKDGHWFILGRSDDTLKVAGKRVGPAEVESILVSHPAVVEAAVIGIPDEAKGSAMVAFCVLANSPPYKGGVDAASAAGVVLGRELTKLVATQMGKPLSPSKIYFVSALPKTRNAKVMRRVIRSAYLGEDPGDLSALEDPKVVEEIAELGK